MDMGLLPGADDGLRDKSTIIRAAGHHLSRVVRDLAERRALSATLPDPAHHTATQMPHVAASTEEAFRRTDAR
jgi:hypothetical protein